MSYHGFHGDVILVVNKIPSNVKKVKKTSRGYVLAEGEVTGHAHTVTDEIELLISETNQMYIHANSDFQINHEEHNTVKVPAGDYEVRIAKEYDHFAEEARNVID